MKGPEATDFRRGGRFAGTSTVTAPRYPRLLNSAVDEQEILDAQDPVTGPPFSVAGGMSVTEALATEPPIQDDARGERIGTSAYQARPYQMYQTQPYQTYQTQTYQPHTYQPQESEGDEDDYNDGEDHGAEETPRPHPSGLAQFVLRPRGGGGGGSSRGRGY